MKARDEFTSLISGGNALAKTQDALPDVVAGTERDERIGRQIFVKRFDVKGRLTLPSAAADNQVVFQVKLCLVLDRQANKLLASSADIYQDANSPAAITEEYLRFRNLGNTNRFRVLWTKEWNVQCNTAGTAPLRSDAGRLFKEFSAMNLKIEYDSTTSGSFTTRTQNSLLWYWIWDATDVGTSAPVLEVYTRIRFTDS